MYYQVENPWSGAIKDMTAKEIITIVTETSHPRDLQSELYYIRALMLARDSKALGIRIIGC